MSASSPVDSTEDDESLAQFVALTIKINGHVRGKLNIKIWQHSVPRHSLLYVPNDNLRCFITQMHRTNFYAIIELNPLGKKWGRCDMPIETSYLLHYSWKERIN
jgi:hypothetical protein